jgi:hypothetical protein
MTRTRSTTRTPAGRGRRRKRRDRIAALLVVLLAVGAGLLAGFLASPQPWQNPAPAPSHPATVPNQGSS